MYDSVEVLRPKANVGLGRARNLGLRSAQGEYVLFLDGDDYFVPGALDTIATALEGKPDMVVFGYDRLYPNGDRVEGTVKAPLQGQVPFTASERVEILDVLNVAWNRAYRRGFLEDLSLQFPVGYYEDIPWTYPATAAARSIATIDEPLYRYRQRSSGSILRSTDARHVEILDQFERLMKALREMQVADDLVNEIYTRAFRNLLTVATTKRSRVPQSMRREFYNRMRSLVATYEPVGYQAPSSGDKWKLMRAVRQMNYARFETRRRLASIKYRGPAKVRSALRSVRRFMSEARSGRLPYMAYRRLTSVDASLVVMENLWGLSPRLNCLAVDREIRESHPELSIVWAVNSDELVNVPAGVVAVATGSREHQRALARAKYFFLDTNLPGWWIKRPGQVFTQLHHGTPLKLMGVEERGKDRAWMNGLLRRSENWDFSLVPSSYCAEVWKHSYPVRCETLELGYPRNDVLVNATASDVENARRRVGVSDARRVFLYMPTFRERDAEGFGRDALLAVSGALGPEDVLLVRGHYFAGANDSGALPSNVVDVSATPGVEDLYLAADVLITDYSSAMFDFANLKRPIIIFAYDWDEYQENRGTYFDITVDAPGAVAKTLPELVEILTTGRYVDEDAQSRLTEFNATFCTFDSGHAARDVVSRVIDGSEVAHSAVERGTSVTTWNLDRLA